MSVMFTFMGAPPGACGSVYVGVGVGVCVGPTSTLFLIPPQASGSPGADYDTGVVRRFLREFGVDDCYLTGI